MSKVLVLEIGFDEDEEAEKFAQYVQEKIITQYGEEAEVLVCRVENP